MTHSIVTITYKDGRIESSAPLKKSLAEWFARMVRASHSDILTIETAVCVS
jgi:hypothetical protein